MKNRSIPLRTWASPSYDSRTGRAASAFAPPGSAATFDAGENVRPDAQVDEAAGKASGGAPNFHEWQASKSQGGARK
jgi:hypothetical protein